MLARVTGANRFISNMQVYEDAIALRVSLFVLDVVKFIAPSSLFVFADEAASSRSQADNFLTLIASVSSLDPIVFVHTNASAPIDSNALVVRFARRIVAGEPMTSWAAAAMPKRTKHVFVMRAADVRTLNRSQLGRLNVNGLIVVAHDDGSAKRLHFLGWHRGTDSDSLAIDLRPFGWAIFVARPPLAPDVQIFFDCVAALPQRELSVYANCQPPAVFNITDGAASEWRLAGREIALVRLVAQQLQV